MPSAPANKGSGGEEVWRRGTGESLGGPLLQRIHFLKRHIQVQGVQEAVAAFGDGLGVLL